MDQNFAFNPMNSRRVAWIDNASVIARVLPESKLAEHKMIASATLCARLADLRHLARRYRAMRLMAAPAHSPLSASLPLAG
jgi:hypothetical protein